MKIIQASVLVLVGALGAMMFLKMKGDSQPQQPPTPVVQTVPETVAPLAAASEEPAPAASKSERKHKPAVPRHSEPVQTAKVEPPPQPQAQSAPPQAPVPVAPPPVAEPPQAVEPPAPPPPP